MSGTQHPTAHIPATGPEPDPPEPDAAALDAADPLAGFRDRFVVHDDDLIYLDGNSLGRLPRATADRITRAVTQEWGRELIRGWGHWIDLGREAADLLAGPVLDAEPGDLVVSDSTSVNLYKLAVAALDAAPDRRMVLVDEDDFPTDRYILQRLTAARGLTLRPVPADPDTGVDIPGVVAAMDRHVALVVLSHVSYRSGALTDMAAVTEAAHRAGAMVLWDLCHSAGAVPVPLRESGADLAVGCTYKYLNAGPGAPALLYVRPDLRTRLRQPIAGWWGQRDQFEMGRHYRPVRSIDRFLVGTPNVLSQYGVLEGARIAAAAGIGPVRAKGMALTAYAVRLLDALPAGTGLRLASPRDPARRGAHVTLAHPRAWQLCEALADAGVLVDFRTPDRIRLGLAPLYTRFADVAEAVRRLGALLASGRYLDYPAEHARIT